MANIISIVNQKGGVGKTTTTVHLGIGLARKGRRVLLADADPQGNLTTSLGWYDVDSLTHTLATLMREAAANSSLRPAGFGYDRNGTERDTKLADSVRKSVLHHAEGVDLIPTNLGLAGMDMELASVISRERVLTRILSCISDDYDDILIDCGSSLGLITVNALTASNSVVIPVQAHYLSVVGMVQLILTVQEVQRGTNPNLKIDGVLITMLDAQTNIGRQSVEQIEEFGKTYGIHVYQTRIPRRTKIAEVSAQGISLYEYDKKSLAAEAYQEFTEEVFSKTEKVRNSAAETVKKAGDGVTEITEKSRDDVTKTQGAEISGNSEEKTRETERTAAAETSGIQRIEAECSCRGR